METEPAASTRDRTRALLLPLIPFGAHMARLGLWDPAFPHRTVQGFALTERHLIDPWLCQPITTRTGFGHKDTKT